jgi:hypothetical protein
MKKYLSIAYWSILAVTVLAAVIKLISLYSGFLIDCLFYSAIFFVACAAVVALTWFALGLWNLAKIYFDAWKAKREYANETKS